MQAPAPAGQAQTWASVTSPPHWARQAVRFIRVRPTWCSRSGSMSSAREPQTPSRSEDRLTFRTRTRVPERPYLLRSRPPSPPSHRTSCRPGLRPLRRRGRRLQTRRRLEAESQDQRSTGTRYQPAKRLPNVAGTRRRSSDRPAVGGALPSAGRLKTRSTGMISDGENRRSRTPRATVSSRALKGQETRAAGPGRTRRTHSPLEPGGPTVP